jgi:hypothetical protein
MTTIKLWTDVVKIINIDRRLRNATPLRSLSWSIMFCPEGAVYNGEVPKKNIKPKGKLKRFSGHKPGNAGSFQDIL